MESRTSGHGINIDFSDFWAKRRAERASASLVGHDEMLEEKVDQLTLICLALCSLLEDKGNFTREELLEHMDRVDRLDGKADGKVQQQTGACPQCGRALSAKYHQCLYCGCRPTDDLSLLAPLPKTPKG